MSSYTSAGQSQEAQEQKTERVLKHETVVLQGRWPSVQGRWSSVLQSVAGHAHAGIHATSAHAVPWHELVALQHTRAVPCIQRCTCGARTFVLVMGSSSRLMKGQLGSCISKCFSANKHLRSIFLVKPPFTSIISFSICASMDTHHKRSVAWHTSAGRVSAASACLRTLRQGRGAQACV